MREIGIKKLTALNIQSTKQLYFVQACVFVIVDDVILMG